MRKFKESTANTIRIIIKTARESVNPCSIESNFYKKDGELHDTASCATVSNNSITEIMKILVKSSVTTRTDIQENS